MIIFGRRASTIGKFGVNNTTCGHCQNVSTQNIVVFGKYAHIFWIPIFPMGKKTVAECSHCKRTIEQKEFSPGLQQRYLEVAGKVKSPIWHWMGLLIVAAFILLITIIGETAEKDARSNLLQMDQKLMSPQPTMETDSISYKLKSIFDDFVVDEINAEAFKYRTVIKEDKVLVLMKIPDFKKVEKEARSQVVEMIETVLSEESDTEGKELYIGIQGGVTMMLVKTPMGLDNSKLAIPDPLYDFYGPKKE